MKISIITVTYNSENSIKTAIESVLGQELMTEQAQPRGDMEQVKVTSEQAGTTSEQAGTTSEQAGTTSEQAEITLAQVETTRGQTTATPAPVQIEYLIIDGASKDKTLEIAESYRPVLEEKGITYRIYSEPDKGIYDAMNKGIRLATGDIIGILNSDDWYEPDTLQTVANTFAETDCELMYANIRMHKTDGSTFIKRARMGRIETSRDWNHPTTFVKAQVYKENPFRDLGIHDDYGFFLQMKRQKRRIVIVDKVLANFRMGGASNHKDFKAAKKRIMDRYKYCYRINGYSRLYMIECVAIEAAKMILG